MTPLRTMLAGILVTLAGWHASTGAAIPDGIVVWCKGTNIKGASALSFAVYSGGNRGAIKTLTSTAGKNPRISPDGKYVAFDNGSSIFVCRLQQNASAVKLGSGAHPYWVRKSDGWYLFYSSTSAKAKFGNNKSYLRKLNTSSLAWAGSAVEVTYDGKSSFMKGGMGTNGTYACTGYPDCVIAKADPNGTVKVISSGSPQKCNPSIAPTSNRMMILDDTDHKTIATYTITGSRWSWRPGGYVQNPEWSTDENWCTWVVGDHSGGQVMVGDIKNKKSYQVQGASGTFPHYYKGSSSVQPKPTLSVSPGSLELTAEKGGSAPSAKTVTVSISEGTLSGLSASESAGWLTTSISGNTVTNTVSIAGLDAKTYTTTVDLSATGADPTSYTVKLTITEPTTPALSVNPGSLKFAAEQGGSAPSAKTVAVSISEGTLSGLDASESAGWLTTSISGNTVTNTVSIAGLDAKTYTTTVSLSATGADPTSYTVTLTVTEPQILTSIVVTPANPTVTLGSQTQFSATAQDQNGADMVDQPGFAWSATGAGDINSSGLFTAASQEGTATVTATAGGKTGSTTVSVEEAPPVALKINCGGSAVGGWSADQYVSGGANFDFGGTVDISNVDDPAPADVYRTVRHKNPTYTIPASVVPNGTYTLRLHFSDGRGDVGDRQMNVTVEGQLLLSNYDIVAEAGGQYVAVVEQFTVSVSDGDGIKININEGSGNDGFVSGIELTAGSSQVAVTSGDAESATGLMSARELRPVQVHSAFGTPLLVSVGLDGEHKIRITDAKGATVATRTGRTASTYSFDEIATPGFYLLRVSGPSLKYTKVVVAGK